MLASSAAAAAATAAGGAAAAAAAAASSTGKAWTANETVALQHCMMVLPSRNQLLTCTILAYTILLQVKDCLVQFRILHG